MDSITQLGDSKIQITLPYESIWAADWIGGLPILNSRTWGKITDEAQRTWEDPEFNFSAVRDYNPIKHDKDENKQVDLLQDGTGPWAFHKYTPNDSVTLTAHPPEGPSWLMAVAFVTLLSLSATILGYVLHSRRTRLRTSKA